MSDHYILGGKDGRKVIPVDTVSWAKWYDRKEGSMEHRRVAKTTVREPNRLLWWLGLRPDYWISTVFLGLDHSWNGGPPLIFETMVFHRWVWWKRRLSELKRPMSMGAMWRKTWDSYPYPKPEGWVLEIGNKLIPIQNPINKLWRWYHRNYMSVHVFREWSENSEQDTDRYSTWDEAYTGHIRMVDKWASR